MDVCLVCCQVEVSVSSSSLVHKIPTDCGVSYGVWSCSIDNVVALVHYGTLRHGRRGGGGNTWRAAACKHYLLDSLTNRATGDMICNMPHLDFTIKTHSRWHVLQHASPIWTPSELKQATGDTACSTQPHLDSLTIKTQHLNFVFIWLHKIRKIHFRCEGEIIIKLLVENKKIGIPNA